MKSLVESAKSEELPDIVWIVLAQAYKFHAGGRIDDQTYREQLERLEREELFPRGLTLCVEERPDGSACFSICYGKSREVCHKLACGPLLTTATNGEEPSSTYFPPGPASRIQPAC